MNKLYLTFILAIFSISTFGQSVSPSVSFEWGFAIGGSGYEWTSEIAVDAWGNMYGCGRFAGQMDFDGGSGTYNVTPNGGDDVFVLKVDSNANLLWAKTIGGPMTDHGYGLALDDAGNVYVSGHFKNSADLDPGPAVHSVVGANAESTFITKLDSTGNFVWGRAWTAGVQVRITDVAYDHGDGLLITGQFEDSCDFDPGVGEHYMYAPSSGRDVFVARLDTAGNFVWAKQLIGSNFVYPRKIDADTFGNVYATGTFQNDVDFDPGVGTHLKTATGFFDGYILKLDPLGNFEWVNTYASGTAGETAAVEDVVVDPQGDVFIAGWYMDSMDIDQSLATSYISAGGNGDAFAMKLQANGSVIWANAFGGNGTQRGEGACTDQYGNVFVIGMFMGATDFDPGPGNVTLISNNYDPATFFVSFDAAGNFRWAKDVGGPPPGSPVSRNFGFSIAVDNDDNVFTGGYYRGIVDLDPTAATQYHTAIGLDDLYFQKFSQCFMDSTIDTVVACDSYTWIDGVTYTINSNSNVYHTLVNSTGCDSVIKLNLQLYPAATSVDAYNTCNELTWIDGNTYTSSNFTATYTIAGGAVGGCDSIITLNLIYTPVTAIDTRVACDSLLWIDGNVYTSNNNTATHIYPSGSSIHCDSIVTLDLTITNSSGGTNVHTACNSFTWLDGNTYTSSNNTATYAIAGGSANGCDSIITLDLTINNVDTTTSATQNTITATASGVTYQWLDCDNNFAPIPGATGQTYAATTNGNYAVQLNDNGCVDTSACVNITGIGIGSVGMLNDIIVYPNPNQGIIFVDLGELKDVTVKVFNLAGQEVYAETNINSPIHNIELSEATGIYFVEVAADGFSARFRLVVE